MTTARTIKLLTLNIWNRGDPWEERLKVIRAGLAEMRPDVVCLQEVLALPDFDQAALIAEGSGYHVAFGSGKDPLARFAQIIKRHIAKIGVLQADPAFGDQILEACPGIELGAGGVGGSLVGIDQTFDDAPLGHHEFIDPFVIKRLDGSLIHRLIGGKVLQDRNSPDGVRDDTEQRSSAPRRGNSAERPDGERDRKSTRLNSSH